jgi:hypothetical protein
MNGNVIFFCSQLAATTLTWPQKPAMVQPDVGEGS